MISLRIVLCSLLTSLPVCAMLDLNGNGISDVWEKANNGGQLLPESYDPNADSDEDGFPNIKEAIAGTNPSDGRRSIGYLHAEVTQESIDSTTKRLKIKWPSKVGKLYSLQSSPDLGSSWSVVERDLKSTESHIEKEVILDPQTLASSKNLFWRVAVYDTDSDGDGLNDHEESQLNTSSTSSDSDGDGTQDYNEVANNTDPTNAQDVPAADKFIWLFAKKEHSAAEYNEEFWLANKRSSSNDLWQGSDYSPGWVGWDGVMVDGRLPENGASQAKFDALWTSDPPYYPIPTSYVIPDNAPSSLYSYAAATWTAYFLPEVRQYAQYEESRSKAKLATNLIYNRDRTYKFIKIKTVKNYQIGVTGVEYGDGDNPGYEDHILLSESTEVDTMEVVIPAGKRISGFPTLSGQPVEEFQIALTDRTLVGSVIERAVARIDLLPVEVVEVSPKTKDEDGNEIAGSEKPNIGKPLTPFVEIVPKDNKIAHRELKVKIGEPLNGKKVTWTLEALPGATPATIRGQWEDSPTHKDRFEASTTYGANEFRKVSQTTGETTVGTDGHTAIRVNVPPIGFNQVRIKIQIEGMSTPMDLIDMEVPGVVIIDPGHGGQDSGAVGAGGVQEKDLALAYSLSLRQELIDKFTHEKQGIQIVMTRKTTEAFPSLTARPQRAKDTGADVLVSIHFNSGAATARGTETFVERTADEASESNPGDNKNVDEDLTLATALNTTTLNAMTASDAGALNRGVKREGKAVTRDGASYNGNTQDYHPVKACLLEVEFLSNATALESIKLSNASGVAIKDAFAENAANDIFTHLRNQQ